MLGSPRRANSRNSDRSDSSFLARHGHGAMTIGTTINTTIPPTTTTNSTHGRTTSQLATASVVDPDKVIGSIRFVPHVEFSSRLSLNFEPIEQKVVDSTHLKIGRFNEKSQNRSSVTFKSKVVSRMHAEIWCQEGAWYIKDAKSSSGTFVNHIRLSPPGQESRPTILADGDTVQFGIDFRGGTEEVYRSVRTKVEVNRVFQRSNDRFNVNAHKKLRNLTIGSSAPQTPSELGTKSLEAKDDAGSTYTAECCICLFAIAPSQALFIAPCSHPYHFKCIRPLLIQHYPNFLCCICRKYADLEASVEVESEAWIRLQSTDADPRTPTAERDEPIFQPMPGASHVGETNDGNQPMHGLGIADMSLDQAHQSRSNEVAPSLSSNPFRQRPISLSAVPGHLAQDLNLERQVTPTNNAGPFLFESAVE